MQALHGDAIHIRYLGTDEQFHNIFVDGGFPVKTYRATVQQQTQELLDSGERIDLFIITHIDQDHIGGVLTFIKEFGSKNLVDVYWFNGSHTPINIQLPNDKISVRQGIELSSFLSAQGLQTPLAITSERGTLALAGGATATILSPHPDDLQSFQRKWANEEGKIAASDNDYDVPVQELVKRPFIEDSKLENKVSISFLFQFGSSSILFLADSHPSTIVHSLRGLGYSESNPLEVNFVKLSHHGSKYNTSDELLALINCNSFIISANGNNRHNFPHKATMARILLHPNRNRNEPIQFIFNYNNDLLRNIFTDHDLGGLNFSCLFPPLSTNGYTVHCNPYRHN